MGRVARIVVPDMPHHLTQRGNRREDIFFTRDDRDKYANLLAENCLRHALAIWAYCWMSNHVHLVAVPARAGGKGVRNLFPWAEKGSGTFFPASLRRTTKRFLTPFSPCQTVLSSWMLLAAGVCRDVRQLWRIALERIAANEVANRPGRIEPRMIKRRRDHYPLMHDPRRELRRKLPVT